MLLLPCWRESCDSCWRLAIGEGAETVAGLLLVM